MCPAMRTGDASRSSERTGKPILDLRTRFERWWWGRPPGSRKVSLLRHAVAPDRSAVYLCQHAVRSKLPAWRGATEIAGGFSAWKRDGLPIEGGRV